MNLSRVLLMLLPAMVLGMVPACKKESGKIKVAVVTNNPANFWKICDAGARKAAKDHDVELIFRMPEKGDPGTQREIVKSLMEQGISGIAISVIDPKEQTRELRQVAEKVTLLTMDNDADESGRLCYVGTDNYSAGRAAGRLVKGALPDGGDVAIFVGQITPANARARFQGVVDELAGIAGKNAEGTPVERMIGDKKGFFKQYGKYYLYSGEAITDGPDESKALENAKSAYEILGDRPDVCFVGLWAYNPPQILRATAEAKNVKVVGFDEDEATLNAIEQGRCVGTIVQDPFNFGYKSVEILAAEARGDKSKSNVKPIPYRIVSQKGGPTTKDGDAEIKNLKAGEFREQLKQLLEGAK